MFIKKGKLRREKDDELIAVMEKLKRRADEHGAIMRNSVEASEEAESYTRLERAKYYFLLKEARIRKTSFR
ncbi:YaaL family protein [Salisediminibacterium halotolerans]|uniref:Uncharacterized protein n=1 Tax=Salisediminibacterium halotolerans TaxID=517425 RepID=A0A1H9WC72_9BACI|nr:MULTISPECIES: YaaL family protein [Salisediminibacterium]RLJ79351.1 uncharacterized protein DUF2508 [Actinophytocola xinjiangensis]RPE83399.1 uncharacterized protein DUF2508 [Salisediminibacterium halotolerans]TWG37793.1 uncharacterized protein DUF2508 [Salisediminibacterium halotolerans]SES31389.1 Protein of unknown function [Salisediminibacterium haloalkalitolerans]GEL09146.1 hypothetical protein SHA02_25620 [Salisediminibacterium halotolerans]